MNQLLVRQFLQQALIEDIGSRDVTSEALFDGTEQISGRLIAKKPGRIAGLTVAGEAFALLDPNVKCSTLAGDHPSDGLDVQAGDTIAVFTGSTKAILSAERVALNMLQRMSGIATTTRVTCLQLEGLKTRVTDTRKTLPGLRMFDKYAVTVGGGINHRFGLYDAVMIKDNHIEAVGSLTQAVQRIRVTVGHMVKIEVEVDTLAQTEEAAALGVDVILLDNMEPPMLREAVGIVRGRSVTEASGRITPETIRQYAETGVDVVSLGWLTHSVQALDISLELERRINR